MLLLQTLFAKYGTDKGTLGYATMYEDLFSRHRFAIQSLLEIGIGTQIPQVNSSMYGYGAAHYKPGASLRAWRDYFPNAFITGLDNQFDTQFIEERITTLRGDSTTFLISDRFDVIIDDGSHLPEDQIQTLKNFWPNLQRNGIYVIEDLVYPYIFEHPGEIRAIIGDTSRLTFVKFTESRMVLILEKL